MSGDTLNRHSKKGIRPFALNIVGDCDARQTACRHVDSSKRREAYGSVNLRVARSGQMYVNRAPPTSRCAGDTLCSTPSLSSTRGGRGSFLSNAS